MNKKCEGRIHERQAGTNSRREVLGTRVGVGCRSLAL